jgi:hypothetical protein
LLPSTATYTHRHQPGLAAQAEQLAEQLSQRRLGADPEARNRGVIGTWFAVITRKATSSRQRRSIAREERSPIAYA